MTTVIISLAIACALTTSVSAILSSNTKQVSVNYTTSGRNDPVGSSDIPYQVLAREVPGLGPDQIHITHWGNASYLFSWASGDGQAGPGVTAPDPNAVLSYVWISAKSKNVSASDASTSNHTGVTLSYMYDYSADVFDELLGPDYTAIPSQQWLSLNYASPLLHHVLVEGLSAGTMYYYRVGDPRYYSGVSGVFSFKTPAAKYPYRMGIVADVGQTANTTDMMAKLMATQIDGLSLIGDFTYADNFGNSGCMIYNYMGVGVGCPYLGREGDLAQETYQPKWDTWGRLWQPILSGVPFFFSLGNHEIEELPNGARFKGVNARYVAPPAAGMYAQISNQEYLRTMVKSQVDDNMEDPRGAYHNMFYSTEVPGATLIYLTSFIGNDDFSSSSVQYVWLEATLKAINRKHTPWVIANFHYPMYSSFAGNYKGNECFRQAFEPLLFKYGVDIVFNGHVHSYERSQPVYNLTLNSCGIVHLVVGDGGNNEGVQVGYIDQYASKLKYCQPGQMKTRGFPQYQPQACYSLNPSTGSNSPGQYCDFTQPIWSAYRSPAWGFGVLTILSPTQASWTWNNTDVGVSAYDSAVFTRDANKCTKGGN